MDLEIVVNRNVPADEFEMLILNYPNGEYFKGNDNSVVRWFRLVIDNKIKLIWFMDW